jgi:polynucleotide 5'-hydroxyl-kinase GRC3/NOL9
MLKLSITLERGKVLLVKGKAYASCKGDVSLLGVNVNGRSINIRHGKILPFEANSDNALVMLELYNGEYSIKDASEGLGTSIWRCVEHVFEHYANSNIRPFKVMLIGATDSGKSTLSTYIANLALARGLKVCIVDADIGQGDIAPPACMGSCILNDYTFDLRDVKGGNCNYYFIGKLSPMGIEGYVIQGLKYLISNVKSDICIVNTDGYIDGYGSIYKVRMIDVVKPEVVVILGNFTYDVKGVCQNVLNLPTPSEVYKSKEDRVARRIEQYRRFINPDNSRLLTFRISSKVYELMGKRVIIMSNKSNHDYNSIRGFKDDELKKDDALTLSASILNGMFVALSMYNTTVGFGLILSSTDGYVRMMSSYEGEFDKIILSSIRLDSNLSMESIIPLPY